VGIIYAVGVNKVLQPSSAELRGKLFMKGLSMECDKFLKSTMTEEDGTCWGCDNFWNNGCPYGKQANENDWRAIDPDYGK
jgi:hypothetical protein